MGGAHQLQYSQRPTDGLFNSDRVDTTRMAGKTESKMGRQHYPPPVSCVAMTIARDRCLWRPFREGSSVRSRYCTVFCQIVSFPYLSRSSTLLPGWTPLWPCHGLQVVTHGVEVVTFESHQTGL